MRILYSSLPIQNIYLVIAVFFAIVLFFTFLPPNNSCDAIRKEGLEVQFAVEKYEVLDEIFQIKTKLAIDSLKITKTRKGVYIVGLESIPSELKSEQFQKQWYLLMQDVNAQTIYVKDSLVSVYPDFQKHKYKNVIYHFNLGMREYNPQMVVISHCLKDFKEYVLEIDSNFAIGVYVTN